MRNLFLVLALGVGTGIFSQSSIFLPAWDDASYYYELEEGFGTRDYLYAYAMQCPPGTLYDINKKMCNWDILVDRDSRGEGPIPYGEVISQNGYVFLVIDPLKTEETGGDNSGYSCTISKTCNDSGFGSTTISCTTSTGKCSTGKITTGWKARHYVQCGDNEYTDRTYCK